jgi:tetratricopeptide (TPR) repeat protein
MKSKSFLMGIFSLSMVFIFGFTGCKARVVANKIETVAPKESKTAEEFLETGIQFCLQGEYDSAIENLTEAITLDSNIAAAYANRGLVYGHKGTYDKALADCNQAIKLDPNLADSYSARGVVYIAKGEYDQALIDCNQA